MPAALGESLDHIGGFRRLAGRLRIAAGDGVRLPGDRDPRDTLGIEHGPEVDSALAAGERLLADLQARLAAQDTYALLVVLQGPDAAGKDGAIKHVMSGVNPQGVSVRRFEAPSSAELDHDYLWRCTLALPARGTIGIFNRSHYEEVLVPRVHPEVLARQHLPAEAMKGGIWRRRFRQINDWERHLVENGTRVVKLFLNLSREEQRRRLLARLEDPEKNWKFSSADLSERRFWDAYQQAYTEMLSQTSTEWAPWFVVPADHKWFARLAVAAITVDALAAIDPHYPELGAADTVALADARARLEADGG